MAPSISSGSDSSACTLGHLCLELGERIHLAVLDPYCAALYGADRAILADGGEASFAAAEDEALFSSMLRRAAKDGGAVELVCRARLGSWCYVRFCAPTRRSPTRLSALVLDLSKTRIQDGETLLNDRLTSVLGPPSTEEVCALAERARLLLQDRYAQRAENCQRELRRYRHDVANHMVVLKALLDAWDMPGARKYLDELQKKLKSAPRLVDTGNPALDDALTAKLSIAARFGIHVDPQIGLPPNLPDQQAEELARVLLPCLDLAIDSCKCAAQEQKEVFLLFSLLKRRNAVVFKLQASAPSNAHENGGAEFPSPAVRQLVQKHCGHLSVQRTPDSFALQLTSFLSQ